MKENIQPIEDARLLLLLRMEEAIHRLSQPLTSITFALELVTAPGEGDERGEILASARGECERAMACVVALRQDVTQLLGQTKLNQKEMA